MLPRARRTGPPKFSRLRLVLAIGTALALGTVASACSEPSAPPAVEPPTELRASPLEKYGLEDVIRPMHEDQRAIATSRNRCILHRKELFVPPDHPRFETFARLTRIEESKGLYEDTSRIGLEDGWKETLAQKELYLKRRRLLAAQGPAS